MESSPILSFLELLRLQATTIIVEEFQDKIGRDSGIDFDSMGRRYPPLGS